MITPIEDIVVVAPALARTAIEMLDPRSCLRGRVLAIGPGRVTSEGVLIEPEIKVERHGPTWPLAESRRSGV